MTMNVEYDEYDAKGAEHSPADGTDIFEEKYI